MKTLNIYEKVLYLALTKNLITNPALLLISKSSQSVYRVIRTAIENGHLKKQTDDFSENKCKFVLTYYYITSSGIKYLIENASDKILWLKFFTPFFSRFKTKGKYSSKRKLEKFLHTTTAAIMCEEIGARSSSYFLTTDTLSFFNTKSSKDWAVNEEIESEGGWFGTGHEVEATIDERNLKGLTLAEMVYEAIEKYKHTTSSTQNGIIKENYNLKFVNSTEIKNSLARDSGNYSMAYDFIRCRYTGFLQSRYKSLAIYVGSPAGLSWQRKFFKKEVSSHSLYSNKVSENSLVKYNDNRAVLLVTNAKMFADIYLDKNEKRAPNEKLGEGFTHFFAVPINENGKKLLSHLIEQNADTQKENIIREAIESNFYQANTEYDEELFPLKNKTGTLIFLGVEMDIIQMLRLGVVMTKFPQNKYGILCFPWQTDYYKRIFPIAKRFTLEEI